MVISEARRYVTRKLSFLLDPVHLCPRWEPNATGLSPYVGQRNSLKHNTNDIISVNRSVNHSFSFGLSLGIFYLNKHIRPESTSIRDSSNFSNSILNQIVANHPSNWLFSLHHIIRITSTKWETWIANRWNQVVSEYSIQFVQVCIWPNLIKLRQMGFTPAQHR